MSFPILSRGLRPAVNITVGHPLPTFSGFYEIQNPCVGVVKQVKAFDNLSSLRHSYRLYKAYLLSYIVFYRFLLEKIFYEPLSMPSFFFVNVLQALTSSSTSNLWFHLINLNFFDTFHKVLSYVILNYLIYMTNRIDCWQIGGSTTVP